MDVPQTIDLDCAPGGIRPESLINSILEGTGLDVTDHPVPFFGAVVYSFDVSRSHWVEFVQPIIKPRITALYNSGTIRYGSW